MGRHYQVLMETQNKQKDLNLLSSEHREIMQLELLAQISETFALYLDIYAATHGVNLQNPDMKKEESRRRLQKVVKGQKNDERIPDAEIPFASDK